MTFLKSHIVVFILAVSVASCGGGGANTGNIGFAGNDPAVVSTLSFPLQKGLRGLSEFSNSIDYSISGTCSGVSSSGSQDAVPSSFEGASAVAVTSTVSFSFINCSPASSASTGTSYFDANFNPLGILAGNGEYGVYAAPVRVPETVMVGDSGTLGVMQRYRDSTKTTLAGQDEMAYVVEANDADSAVVDIMTRSYAANSVLMMTSHDRYRIVASGAMIPLYTTITTPSINLLLTAQLDRRAPYVTSVSPYYDSGASSGLAAVEATFSEVLDTATIQASAFFLVSETGVVVPGSINYSGRKLTFTPLSPLADGRYTATIAAGVKDWAGNSLGVDFLWSFRVGPLPQTDFIPPTVSSVTPAANATSVAITAYLTMYFSESVNSATLNGSVFTLTDGTRSIPGMILAYGTYATFYPAANLYPNTTYTATIGTGLKDLAGNSLTAPYVWSFTTEDLHFTSAAQYWVGAQGEAVAIGDVNGDGRNDAIMTSRDSLNPLKAYGLHVVHQDAAGGMGGTAVTYPTHSSPSCIGSTVAVGDLNSDGKSDVVIGNSVCGIEVFLQNSVGGLNAGVVHASSDAGKIRVGDLNNDGRMDVVGVGTGTGTASVWLQNAAGGLDAPVIYQVSHGGGEDVDVGDVNNDGLTDVVISSSDLRIGVLTQAANGTLNAPVYYGIGTVPANGVAVGDINGDGKSDVVITAGLAPPDTSIGVFYQNASGTLDAMVSHASDNNPYSVEIADVTGDGRKDVVVHHVAWSRIGLYEQNLDGSLTSETPYLQIPYGRTNPQNMAIGDINGDGKPDAVFSGFEIAINY
jgi:hypothetical protein